MTRGAARPFPAVAQLVGREELEKIRGGSVGKEAPPAKAERLDRRRKVICCCRTFTWLLSVFTCF